MKHVLAVISACCECVHSRDSESCVHPDTTGKEEHAGRGTTPYRPLDPVDTKYGAFASNAPPPVWCPLRAASEAHRSTIRSQLAFEILEFMRKRALATRPRTSHGALTRWADANYIEHRWLGASWDDLEPSMPPIQHNPEDEP